MAWTDERIEEFATATKVELGEFRQDVRGLGSEVGALRNEMHRGFVELRGALVERIDAQGTALVGLIDAQGAEFGRRIEVQGAELGARIDAQGAELGRRIEVQGAEHGARIDAQGA